MHVSKSPDLIGSVEAAEILGVDVSTVSRWVTGDRRRTRRLTVALRLPGKTGAKLFRRTDVEALANELAEQRERAS